MLYKYNPRKILKAIGKISDAQVELLSILEEEQRKVEDNSNEKDTTATLDSLYEDTLYELQSVYDNIDEELYDEKLWKLGKNLQFVATTISKKSSKKK